MKSNQCSAIFILMVFVSVKANPMPQEDESGNERTRTDLCDEFEFQEFVGDQVQCYGEAGRFVEQALSTGSTIDVIKVAICKTLTEKGKCITEKGFQCLNQEEMDNVFNNFIAKEFEKAFNETELLGRDFIDSCPVLRDNEDTMVLRLTGTDACDFFEFRKKYVDFRKCEKVADEKHQTDLALLQFVQDKLSFLTRSVCDYRQDYYDCHKDYEPCLSTEKSGKLMSSINKLFTLIETTLRGSDSLSTFSLDTSCVTNEDFN